MLQVTAEMSVYNGLKGIRRYIYIVNVNGMQVEVLGTTFNISAYPNEEYQTTLVNGSVRVSAEKGESLILPKASYPSTSR